MNPLFRYTLALGDDALVLAQRCGQWITNAPQLEEDVALANIGLDLLGQARMLLTYAGEVENRPDGVVRSEDDLAYLRDERDFLNLHIVERPNEDFAVSTARLLLFSTYQLALYQGLTRSADETLAAIAAKAVKEVAYHRDHAAAWTVRLGDGTELSHQRMQAGLERVWPYAAEMFDSDWLDPGLTDQPGLVGGGVAVDPSSLHGGWLAAVEDVVEEATLELPAVGRRPGGPGFGGRFGVHTEDMGYLLAELQHLHRSFPGARW